LLNDKPSSNVNSLMAKYLIIKQLKNFLVHWYRCILFWLYNSPIPSLPSQISHPADLTWMSLHLYNSHNSLINTGIKHSIQVWIALGYINFITGLNFLINFTLFLQYTSTTTFPFYLNHSQNSLLGCELKSNHHQK